MNLPGWLKQAWPFPAGRSVVVDQYAILGRHKALLADIAMRGSVFDAADVGAIGNAYAAGVFEGRRQMALETIRLADTEPALLLGYIPTKPAPETRS